MRWKQFFTPVKSLNPEAVRNYIESQDQAVIHLMSEVEQKSKRIEKLEVRNFSSA